MNEARLNAPSLADLFAGRAMPSGVAGLRVHALTADSRAIEAGSLFFAVPGARADGLAFAAQAAKNGAVAIVSERAPASDPGAPVILVDDVRAELSRAAAQLHARQPRIVAAVTGTSGKTSVAAFLRQIWLSCGHAAGSLGTIGVVAPSGAVYGSLTTPDPVTLHRTLDALAGEGVSHLALEASSHGLDQRRLDGVRLAAAAFTNLSRDHLDYHPSVEDYFAAKMRLFDTLMQPGRPAVIEADGDHAERVAETARNRGLDVFTVGAQGAGLRLIDHERQGFDTRIVVGHGGRAHDILLPLAGSFQASNALVAAGLALVTGSDPQAVFNALADLKGAPGRLERIGQRRGGLAFVDYAHKPDALEKALDALRPYTTGRLIVVFGCGGDRDSGKRPIMGEIATRKADCVIVTDDNPRSEDPASIRAEILAAAPGAREIGDRRAAIRFAVESLRKGDVLLVAGKGHEEGQIVGAQTHPFSDHEAVATALEDFA